MVILNIVDEVLVDVDKKRTEAPFIPNHLYCYGSKVFSYIENITTEQKNPWTTALSIDRPTAHMIKGIYEAKLICNKTPEGITGKLYFNPQWYDGGRYVPYGYFLMNNEDSKLVDNIETSFKRT